MKKKRKKNKKSLTEMLKKFFNKKLKGFTLVELLVVIAIIGILATIGIANFRSSQIKARDAKRQSDVEQISKSLESYLNDHGKYPDSSNGKIVCQPSAATPDEQICDWGEEFSDGSTTYMTTLPTDPYNYEYRYESINGGAAYSLFARFENTNNPTVNSNITEDCTADGDDCSYVVTSPNYVYIPPSPSPTPTSTPTPTPSPTPTSTPTPTPSPTPTPDPTPSLAPSTPTPTPTPTPISYCSASMIIKCDSLGQYCVKSETGGYCAGFSYDPCNCPVGYSCPDVECPESATY